MPYERYNGWSNYATWRVNLEMFDGFDPKEYDIDADCEAYDLGKFLQGYAEEMLEMDASHPASLVLSYALAFLANVNWTEIARHMLQELEED